MTCNTANSFTQILHTPSRYRWNSTVTLARIGGVKNVIKHQIIVCRIVANRCCIYFSSACFCACSFLRSSCKPAAGRKESPCDFLQTSSWKQRLALSSTECDSPCLFIRILQCVHIIQPYVSGTVYTCVPKVCRGVPAEVQRVLCTQTFDLG